MSYSEAHLQALQTALTKGERRVTFQDKTVEYRSVDELKVALKEVRRALFTERIAEGLQTPAPRQIRVTTTKGF